MRVEAQSTDPLPRKLLIAEDRLQGRTIPLRVPRDWITPVASDAAV
jgi:hypothetical protein